MPLPSSGILGLERIAVTDGANSVGVVTPYSLRQLSILAGKTSTPNSISSFYNYPGYGYINGSPDILHDFGLSSRFPTSSSNIIDTSGNGRTGTFVTGTGNGSPTNITGYTTAFPGNIATQTSSQYAVKLNDVAKYGGTSAFTWIAWFRNTSFPTNYNGIISCEGRTGGGTAIGHSIYISDVGGISVNYQRFDGTTGNPITTTTTFGASGVPAFVSGKWYMVAVTYGFSGNQYSLLLYVDGVQFSKTFIGTLPSVTTDASWGCFAGLRYNNWLNGNIGYVATYPAYVFPSDISIINTNTRLRYE
jgi:hypothetical protein